ncbi:amidohydrolase, partial [Streptomyces sp. NPDC087850]|uniref:amidohydrolase n=1 Tax=Streptomyces sp. NPDC087850 TaxID=3365809 RepID=UPI00382524E9
MIETVSLVDQHCHGALRTELGLGTFETQLAGTASAAAAGTTFFDTQTGFAVRRWCPPLLGLEPHCTPARYLGRRRELGTLEVSRRLLGATGITTYLVDTGLPGDLASPAEMAAMGQAGAREIVRLESLAARVADVSGGVGTFLAGLAESVHTVAATAVALSSATGTGHGLAPAPEPPGPGAVRGAAARWLAERRTGEPPTDPVLLRHLLWTAVGSGLPLQLRSGADGPLGDPASLAGFAAATAGLGTELILLDSYPHHRQAAQLAGFFPHVYADLGPALVHTGAGARAVLAEMLELAPFGKL